MSGASASMMGIWVEAHVRQTAGLLDVLNGGKMSIDPDIDYGHCG